MTSTEKVSPVDITAEAVRAALAAIPGLPDPTYAIAAQGDRMLLLTDGDTEIVAVEIASGGDRALLSVFPGGPDDARPAVLFCVEDVAQAVDVAAHTYLTAEANRTPLREAGA